jgi:hypothetical protein
MGIFLWLFLIPFVGIIAPIWLSFDPDIKANDKVYLFLLLPIVEILVLIVATIESISNKTNKTGILQLELIDFLMIFGLSLTLIVVLVENINRSIQLGIRLTALSILGFIFVCKILYL